MSKAKLYQKLARAKKNFGDVVKESKNPFFKSHYANLNTILDAVEPALEAEGLLLLQPTLGSGENYVKTQIIDLETGEMIESSLLMPNSITDPQKVIAGTTYYRRGTLKALLGLQELDDDGNYVSSKVEKLEVETKAVKAVETKAPTVAVPANGGWKRPLGAKVANGTVTAPTKSKDNTWDDA